MNIDTPSLNTFAIPVERDVVYRQTRYCKIIDSLVNLGSHILNAMRENVVAHPDKRDIVLVLYRRIVELLDSGSILIEEGSIIPSVGNLRILLEASLQLHYLLLNPNLILLKCKHFMIMELDGDLDILTNIINSPRLSISEKMSIKKSIEEIQAKINDSQFNEIRSDYINKVFKQNGERKSVNNKWYSFSSNANNVKYLADNLEKTDHYDSVYSIASNITHSSRLLSDSLYTKEGTTYIRRIRDTEDVENVAKAFIIISIDATQLVAKHLQHDERFKYLKAREEFNRRYKFKIPNDNSFPKRY